MNAVNKFLSALMLLIASTGLIGADQLIFNGKPPLSIAECFRNYKEVNAVNSSDGAFSLQVYQSTDKDGMDFAVVLSDRTAPTRKEVIFQGMRSLGVGWSPDSKVLFVNERSGSGQSQIDFGTPTLEKGVPSVDWIYSTRHCMDSHKGYVIDHCMWRIVRWKVSHGAVMLECTWNYTTSSPLGWYKKQFEIPLSYEPVDDWRLQDRKRPLQVLQQSVIRGTPFGDAGWVSHAVTNQGLETTIRPRGRPRKLLGVA
jgi:hypothetical protein